MGDCKPAEGLTRRRRATLAGARAATLQSMNGRSEAGFQSSVTADISLDSWHKKRDYSLETSRTKSKNDQTKRRSDVSDMLR